MVCIRVVCLYTTLIQFRPQLPHPSSFIDADSPGPWCGDHWPGIIRQASYGINLRPPDAVGRTSNLSSMGLRFLALVQYFPYPARHRADCIPLTPNTESRLTVLDFLSSVKVRLHHCNAVYIPLTKPIFPGPVRLSALYLRPPSSPSYPRMNP